MPLAPSPLRQGRRPGHVGPHPGVGDDVLDVAAHLKSRHGKSLHRNEGLGNSGGDCDCHPSALGDFPMSLTHPVCIRGVIHADITAPHKRRGRRRGGASWCATSSCPSYPAPPFPPPPESQSQLSIQQQLRMGGIPTLAPLDTETVSVCSTA